jgi:flagellar basal body rod protein FlgC
VEANRAQKEDDSGPGFFDIFSAALEGVARGKGLSAQASQMHTTNQNLAQMRSESGDAAEAYKKRIDLLDQVSMIRKCN